MRKIIFVLSMLVIFAFSRVSGFAQNQIVVQGAIEQIGDNGAFIVVDGQNIATEQGFIDDAYFEVGDEVKIIAEEGEDGLKAIDFEYIDSGDDPADEY